MYTFLPLSLKIFIGNILPIIFDWISCKRKSKFVFGQQPFKLLALHNISRYGGLYFANAFRPSRLSYFLTFWIGHLRASKYHPVTWVISMKYLQLSKSKEKDYCTNLLQPKTNKCWNLTTYHSSLEQIVIYVYRYIHITIPATTTTCSLLI